MGKHKKHHQSAQSLSIMDWYGFALSLLIVGGITSYALFVSFGAQYMSLQSAPQESLALVGLAVSNNVGTGSSRASEIPVLSPEDTIKAQNAVVYDAMNREVFFVDIFDQLSQYEEVAQIDIPLYLNGKPNRKEALESYIDELVRHTEKAKVLVQSLSDQILFHTDALKNVQSDIKNTQANIEQSYLNRDSSGIMNNIADLDELTLMQQDHTYGRIFAQQTLNQYESVIRFSENKLEVIQANIPALVQGVTVNLPQGTQVKDLEQLQIFSRETL